MSILMNILWLLLGGIFTAVEYVVSIFFPNGHNANKLSFKV